MEELFSVIVPVYNREALITSALNSVFDQTYRPIQLIIIDDGSTDCTAGTIRMWIESLKKDSEFMIEYIYQENGGVSSARNTGISRILGRYVQFLDSDDLIHNCRLEKLANMFKSTSACFIQTGFESFDANSEEVLSTHFCRTERCPKELILEGKFWANTLRASLTSELISSLP